MGDIERFIQNTRAANSEYQQERAREYEVARELSKQRAKDFIDFMERNDLNGRRVYAQDAVETIYFRWRSEWKGVYDNPRRVLEHEAKNSRGGIKADYAVGRQITYTPVGNGWLIRAPEVSSHFDVRNNPGYLLLDNGAIIWLDGGYDPHFDGLNGFDRASVVPPSDALIIPPYNPDAAYGETTFARDECYNELLTYAAAAIGDRDPISPHELEPEKPSSGFVDPKTIPVVLDLHDDETGEYRQERFQ